MDENPDHDHYLDDDALFDGAGERVSLDQPSKFTLTRFRRSKFTRAMLWFVSLLGLGSAG